MKRVWLFLFLAMPYAALACMPSRYPLPVWSEDRVVWVVRVVDCSMPDYWINSVVWDKAQDRLLDSTESLQALISRPCSVEEMESLSYAFYPALRDTREG
jgi:hypothetical protein